MAETPAQRAERLRQFAEKEAERLRQREIERQQAEEERRRLQKQGDELDQG